MILKIIIWFAKRKGYSLIKTNGMFGFFNPHEDIALVEWIVCRTSINTETGRKFIELEGEFLNFHIVERE